jgi:tetratricopeptide (TPR) repeat protein
VTGLDHVGVNLDAQGHHSEAEQFHRESLRVYEGTLGKTHPELAACLNNLAVNLDAQGNHAGANRLFVRALAINIASLGAEHPTTASAFQNLALSEITLARYDKALEYAEAALRVRQGIQGGITPSASQYRRDSVRTASASSATAYIRAAWGFRRGGREIPQARLAKAFEVAQTVRVSSAADAMVAGAARALAERIGADTANWKALQSQITTIDGQITEAASQGPKGDADRISLSVQREAAVKMLAGTEHELKTRFPRYLDLFVPQPISVGGASVDVRR